MEKRFTEKNDEIVLHYASADDGHWAEIAPETVRVLREYLATDRYSPDTLAGAFCNHGNVNIHWVKSTACITQEILSVMIDGEFKISKMGIKTIVDVQLGTKKNRVFRGEMKI